MFEEEADQQAEAADDTAADVEGEGADDTEGASTEDSGADDTEGASSEDSGVAAAVDQQAASSEGTGSEAEPEVPSDASNTIARAQEHIDNLNMDKEREAAKKAI